jgi:hypothetical protein
MQHSAVPSENSRASSEDFRRRRFLARVAALPLFGFAAPSMLSQSPGKKLNIMIKSAWGSDDPTKAAFPFHHGLALAEAGHNVQISLLGEGTYLMKKSVAEAITPVGWPALSGVLLKVSANRNIKVFS